jgi:hypothetical protein
MRLSLSAPSTGVLMTRSVHALLAGLLALTAAGPLLPAAQPAPAVLVLPYVQPGDGATLTGSDVKVICWMTDQVPGDFVVEFAANGGPVRTAVPTRTTLDFPAYKPPPVEVAPPPRPVIGKTAKPADPPKETAKEEKEPKTPQVPEREQHYFQYAATLDGLPFNADLTYRVKLNGKLVREATTRTRATADRSVRFCLVGDLAQGRSYQKAIAHRIAGEKPEFLVALGDIVYPTGRTLQYMAYFWDTYNNVPEPGPKAGAPLMASVPFYPVLGNHDIGAKYPLVPDALAVYRFFHVPKNGPGYGPWATPVGLIGTDRDLIRKLAAETAGNYPALDAYSFDYGPVHVAVINDNARMAVTDPAFTKWLTADLTGTAARWKLVCFHVPGFQASKQHYSEQQARLLQPLFETCGVDFTFAGHVHNYQRTVPLTFTPDGKGLVKGKVNGKFVLDVGFDGVKNTVPKGVIHITAGGGGASLYKGELDKLSAEQKKLHGDNFAPFTARHVSDRHSFVILDVSPDKLDLRAIGIDGGEIDRITVTKGK